MDQLTKSELLVRALFVLVVQSVDDIVSTDVLRLGDIDGRWVLNSVSPSAWNVLCNRSDDRIADDSSEGTFYSCKLNNSDALNDRYAYQVHQFLSRPKSHSPSSP